MGFGDLHQAEFLYSTSFRAQMVYLVLTLLSLGFTGCPPVIILTGLRYRVPMLRWAPMAFASLALLFMQLGWLLVLL